MSEPVAIVSTAICGRCEERRTLVAHGALCQPCLDVLTLLAVMREAVGVRVGEGTVVVGQHFYASGPHYDALLRLFTEREIEKPTDDELMEAGRRRRARLHGHDIGRGSDDA